MKTFLHGSVQSIVRSMVLFLLVIFSTGIKNIHAVESLNTSKLLTEVKTINKLAPNPIPYEIVVEPGELLFSLVQGESASDFITLTLIGDMVVNYQISIPCFGEYEAKSTDSDWLWVYPESGELWPYSPIEVDVFVDALGLQPGFYSECMLVESDDVWIYPVEVMVYLEVLTPPLQPPQNLQAEMVDDVNVQLIWDAPESMLPIGYNIYRYGEVVSIVADTLFLDTELITGSYNYFVSAIYPEGESDSSNSVDVIINDLSEISVNPLTVTVYHNGPPLVTEETIFISNGGASNLQYAIELVDETVSENSYDIDVGVTHLWKEGFYYHEGPNYSLYAKIHNYGNKPQANIPVTVNWEGVVSGNAASMYLDTLFPGEYDTVFFSALVYLPEVGSYLFDACSGLMGDENSENDCLARVIKVRRRAGCVDGLYTSGCDFGDGLVSWKLSNVDIPDIPCEVVPPSPWPWYHEYKDVVHVFGPGQYQLEVKAGYDDTYFDVWIDYDNDLYYEYMIEHILDDGFCEFADTTYVFDIIIPDSVAPGYCTMRARTNWQQIVFDDCETLAYGNCCDFGVYISNALTEEWLTAYPMQGLVSPQQTDSVNLIFNSYNLPLGIYNKTLLIISNDPNNPIIEVPVTLHVTEELQVPQNLQASVVEDVNVQLTWEAPEDMIPIGYNIYRDSEVISTVVDTSFLNVGLITGTYQYKVTALYEEGESEASNSVEVWITDLSQISITPQSFVETHDNSPQITEQNLTITNEGESPLFITLEIDEGLDGGSVLFTNDVGIGHIMKPWGGANLDSLSPIELRLDNYGTNPQSNIPIFVEWNGALSGSYSYIYTDELLPNEQVAITLPYLVNLTAIGDYTFTACTQLDSDEQSANDCFIKEVTHDITGLFIAALYSSGCNLGDGLISWSLSNVSIPDIPCEPTPPIMAYDYYHFYPDSIHYLPYGENQLTVKAGYSSTWFDVWIDYNDDLIFADDELVIDDALCEIADLDYNFPLIISDTATKGWHYMRVRTNWQAPVTGPRETYSYGNCCDFIVVVSDGDSDYWLTLNPHVETIPPQESVDIKLLFNSSNLTVGHYEATINVISNDPNNPTIEVPVTLNVDGPCPYPPPQNLVGSLLNEYEVLLQWEPPILATYLQWDDGVNGDAIGLAGVYDWQVAARWEAEDLVPHAGMYLSSVGFFPTSTMGAEYIIKVWKGENAGTLMTEQLVDYYAPNLWNYFFLENPVPIDTTQELWIGYHIEEFEVGDYPAGTDSGPAITGFGDMIDVSGVWETLSMFGIDYNWNIAGVLRYDSDGKTLAKEEPVKLLSRQPIDNVKVLKSDFPPTYTMKSEYPEVELLGYNIYRDAMQINSSIVQDTFFIDQLQPPGSYDYFVTAIYYACESEPSNTVTMHAPPPAPEIAVFPLEFVFELEVGITIDDVMNISNIGYDTLEYSITISFETGLTDDNWLTVYPLNGSLPENQNQVHAVQVNANELLPGGYYAIINITSSDPNNPDVEIPVTLDVITSIEEYQNSSIQLFPNPAKDEVFIQSKHEIQKVRMLSHLGEVLMEKEFADHEIRLDVSILKPGVYIVEIETGAGKAVRKLVVSQ